MYELAGKTTFITGGASGIGLGLARSFANAGLKIALADRDTGRLLEAKKLIKAKYANVEVEVVSFDVADYAAWQNAVDEIESKLGPISILCNSAGIGGGTLLHEDDPVRWRSVIEVNLMGTFYGIRTLLPRLLARNTPGHIVNIASLSGLRSHPGMSSYDASKHAVVGMSDSLRKELDGTNIGLSVVYPGMTNTGFVTNSQQIISEKTNTAFTKLNSGIADMLKAGMDPQKVAERVLQAISQNEYHVFTHADVKPAMAAHFEERLAAFGQNADPDYCENLDGLAALIKSGNNLKNKV